MEMKPQSTDTNRIYESFDPSIEWEREASYDTLIAHLPGFKKEQLKVQVTSSRNLRIIGERPIGNNKWIRFHKEIPVPSNYDTNTITAKFENSKLHIKHPKVIAPAQPEPESKPPTLTENLKSQRPVTTVSKAPSKSQEEATQQVPSKTQTIEKQKSATDVSKKPKQELQALMRSNGQEPASEEAPPQTDMDKQASKGADQKPPEKEKEASFIEEKTGASEVVDAKTVPRKSLGSKKEDLDHEEGNVADNGRMVENKHPGGATSSSDYSEAEKDSDDSETEKQPAAETSHGGDKSRVVEDFKQAFGVLVREMKHSRKLMNLAVAFLFVLIVVIYVRNTSRSIGKSDD